MATNGTDVMYNGVTLRNVNTRQWEMEAIYDEDDTLSYYRLQMQFDTIFLPYTSGGGGQLGVQAGGDAPEAWNINKRLLMNRKTETPFEKPGRRAPIQFRCILYRLQCSKLRHRLASFYSFGQLEIKAF